MDKNAFHKLIGVEESYEAPAALMEILYNREERESLFKEMLKLHDFDLSYDWFHGYFQNEHADRKVKKQDYTPASLGKLLNKLTGDINDYYEVAVGTGGILIQSWNENKYNSNIFTYKPSDYFHVVEELDNRNIPFLLFNIMIRGMNAVVIHGDSLSRNTKGVFFVQNYEDDYLCFSDLNIMSYSNDVANEFGVNFYKGEYYKPHIERVKSFD